MADHRKKNNFTPQKKIKVLAYCDTPTCATGFASASRNILMGLYATGKYDIDILGINYWGDPHTTPFRIYPVGINPDRDPYGRKKVFTMIQQMDFDILFFLQDTFILDFLPELQNRLRDAGKKFRSICYFPIDGVPKEQWIHNVNACDYLVAYTEFGKSEAIKTLPIVKQPHIIPHGVNTKEFFPADKKDVIAFRNQFFGRQANKYIFCNVNRNQQRKDIPRTIAAFAEFKKEVPESLAYLHCSKKDQGWDLTEVVKMYNLDTTTDVIFPENFGPNQGYPRNIVNMLYNASDCVVSTTLGEGFGFCLHPDTTVYTINGPKPIKSITVLDKVLSSNGLYNDVEAVMSRDHDGKLYAITTTLSYSPVNCSPEHGFKVLDINNEYAWKKAGDLTIEDRLLFPRRVDQYSIDKERFSELFSSYIISSENPVNADYLIIPIKSIEVEDYVGKLVDIQVANTNDFVAENVIVHNSWIEAMATKTPVIMPNNTALTEFITPETGWLVNSGSNPSLFTVVPNDNEVIRPLVDVEDMVRIMKEVYYNKEETNFRVENAYKWVTSKMDWIRNIVPEWIKLFNTAYNNLKNDDPLPEQSNNIINTESF